MTIEVGGGEFCQSHLPSGSATSLEHTLASRLLHVLHPPLRVPSPADVTSDLKFSPTSTSTSTSLPLFLVHCSHRPSSLLQRPTPLLPVPSGQTSIHFSNSFLPPAFVVSQHPTLNTRLQRQTQRQSLALQQQHFPLYLDSHSFKDARLYRHRLSWGGLDNLCLSSPASSTRATTTSFIPNSLSVSSIPAADKFKACC